MNKVFVLDTNRQPLQPTHPANARRMLKAGKAAVYRKYPFTIILKRAVDDPAKSSLRLKIDPGSRVTGIAIVDDQKKEVVFAAELHHRGHIVKQKMDERRMVRRSRRNRKTRYRQPRFGNRPREEGWLPPSLESRLGNIDTWVSRFGQYAPITALSMELVKFDTQAMQNPEISGVEYQQGELAGYEAREYLLEKYCRRCVYCGAENVPLEIEHIVPRSRGGSNRVSNLAISCIPCNREKGHLTAEEYGHPHVQRQAKMPSRDAAAANATRWALWRRLEGLDLPLETGSGGLTKYNRTRQGYPKAHWIDAACVGETGENIKVPASTALLIIEAKGRGSRQMCSMDRFGFPRTKAKTKTKRIKGFQTGDMVKADIPKGKNKGSCVGRVLVRATGSFDIKAPTKRVGGVSHEYCTLVQRADGYSYT